MRYKIQHECALQPSRRHGPAMPLEFREGVRVGYGSGVVLYTSASSPLGAGKAVAG